MSPTLPRAVHPAAWWVWAIGMAVAVSTTNNPILLALALAVVALVVAARRGSLPVGARLPALPVARAGHRRRAGGAPRPRRPQVRRGRGRPPARGDAARLGRGDPARRDGLPRGPALRGRCRALRLAVIIACVGAANALANPKRLLRALPGALHEIGSAVVVSVSVAPQLAESVQRVRRARQLRGDTTRGLRSVQAVALPVLEDTLDRSLLLAAAMDSRGYGRSVTVPPRRPARDRAR